MSALRLKRMRATGREKRANMSPVISATPISDTIDSTVMMKFAATPTGYTAP